MKSKVEEAVVRFKKGYNCAQAVVCTYCEDFGVKEEDAFRLAEGFGSGIPGLQTICGAASGMIMLCGLCNCLKMDLDAPTKKDTYVQVRALHQRFAEAMGDISCKMLLQTKDNTLIDGKRAGCIECVRCAAALVEGHLYEK